VTRRLEEIHAALERVLAHAPEPVASYCTRLDCLVNAALTRLRAQAS
jgi:hypothetical protein